MLKLTGKIALVTGGGRGIGRAVALAFAREGADVVLAARTREQVERVAEEVSRECGVTALPLSCDVADARAVTAMFEEATKRFGRGVDILVNNAGIAESAPLVKTSDELWHRHLAVNLSGTFYCTRAALPAMIERGWGRVINMASVAGKTGAPYIAAYTASKHGVLGLTRSCAMEVATRGVTVNAICPGYVETEMAEHAISNITNKTGKSETEARAVLEQMSPQRRLITAEEVAALALLLASDEGRGINGQAINVDGGSVMF
ncbi:MAG TPA: SDR family NAD(P)-dependent oxidoreductase [Pyrinomonadaceae bacterium]|nr:SDR family NAD(P)-dependent oxidoreductase [Pyrinomonadaceae bacterium]